MKYIDYNFEPDKIFFTSDLHIKHKKCVEYRGFDSADFMFEVFIENINKTVPVDAVLVLGGDTILGPHKSAKQKDIDKYNERLRTIRSVILCDTIHYILGNHDHQDIDATIFDSVSSLLGFKVAGRRVVICHYAMLTFPDMQREAYQLYCHSHDSLETFFTAILPERRSMDIGIDSAKRILGEFRPFSWFEINNILKDRKGYIIDHHGAHNRI